jgi:plasmid stability protein
MNSFTIDRATVPPRPDAERVTALLARYPRVSRDEAREILTFLRTGRYRDVGALASDRGLGRNLDEFLKDHWPQFHLHSDHGGAVMGGVAFVLLLAGLAWAALS